MRNDRPTNTTEQAPSRNRYGWAAALASAVVVAALAVASLVGGGGTPGSSPQASDVDAAAAATAAGTDRDESAGSRAPDASAQVPADETAATTTDEVPAEPPVPSAEPSPVDADELPEPVQAELAESAEVGSAEVGGAVRAEVAAVDVVRARPEGPGDIGGDAYRVRVVLHNGSDEPLDLGAVLLTVDTADGVPAAPITGDPSVDPLGGELAPGGSAEGTYLFSVPDTDSGDIEVSFSYSIKAPVAVFTGDPRSA